MKSHLTLLLVLGMTSPLVAQDHIVTWNDDTIQCKFPVNPAKEGFKSGLKNKNAYLRTPVIFNDDSSHVIEPGTIKAYTRAKHGKYYLCNGSFESRKVDSKQIRDIYRPRKEDNSWYFMQPLVKGRHVSLYRMYITLNRLVRPVYLISRPGQEDMLMTTAVFSRKELFRAIDDHAITSKLEEMDLGKRPKHFAKVVEHYNRLKESSTK